MSFAVSGEVVTRDENTRNPKIATGDVEVHARELKVLNDARTPPFQLDATSEALAAEGPASKVSLSRSASPTAASQSATSVTA
jgi:aspartyl-tRNA synthetase